MLRLMRMCRIFGSVFLMTKSRNMGPIFVFIIIMQKSITISLIFKLLKILSVFVAKSQEKGTFFIKIPKHGYLFWEILPLNMGMGPEHIPDQTKSENPNTSPPHIPDPRPYSHTTRSNPTMELNFPFSCNYLPFNHSITLSRKYSYCDPCMYYCDLQRL